MSGSIPIPELPGTTTGLSMMDGIILDMVASGKTPREIAEVAGVTPAEATRRAYELLDTEIVTNPEQRRKLQVYRLEKMVQALWDRVMSSAEKDDVRNLREILQDLNTLLALNKEQDMEMLTQITASQFKAYMFALAGVVRSFQLLAPDLMTPDQWNGYMAEQLEKAKYQLTTGRTEEE